MKIADFEIPTETVVEYASTYGLKILGALAIFIVGKWAVKLGVKLVQKVMEKTNVDPTLISFGGNILNALGVTFVILAVLGQVGIQTASLIAVLGAAGLAVGLALQGSLSNFAAGVMIIIFRPFKVGDYVEVAGVSGTVNGLNIFTTTLATPDNKTVIVPNDSVSSGTIINYSANKTRRVDLIFGIGYDDDILKAKKILSAILSADSRVLKDPAPLIAVDNLGESSVDFVVRPWARSEDYWELKRDLTEKVKLTFDEEGISIPFPQRDVHLHGVAAALDEAA